MKIWVAIKSFLKAFKEPKKAQQFLEDKQDRKSSTEKQDPSHLFLLTLLQQSARLIDFLKEDISKVPDVQVGAAVRKIHADCGKILEELVTIRPIYQEEEGTKITIPSGYNPNEVRVIGNVKGEPPYTGILVHRGWKAHKRSLPKKQDSQVVHDLLCSAEVEVK